MRFSALLAFCMLTVISSFAQTHVVRGVLTTFNKYPVQNVTVESKKAKSAVTTDSLGRYELVCNEKDVILIKTDVFETVNERVDEDDNYISTNLVFRNSKKNRQIATGMGYISEENLTYALAHLGNENNDFCKYGDIFSLIQGKFNGVEVRNSPSGGRAVFVRGQKSLTGSNEAIYVVDGIRVVDVSYVIPCEMATIDILKDGGAAMYGSSAANGVVVIETKGYKQQQSLQNN